MKYKLNPNWNAEGCFYVRIAKSKCYRTGWLVQAYFQLGFHTKKDKDLLLQIKSFFNEAGSIYTINNKAAVLYQIRNLSDITKVIIPHFDKYPLISQKRSDYILFKNIVELMDKGGHLKEDSLIKIVNLRAALNRGLSDELKLSFPEVTKIEKYKINPPLNIDYNWIAGFFIGEAYFSVTTRLLLQVSTAQRSIDELLMNSLMNTLKCGIVSEHSKGVTVLTVSRFKDIYNKIISLFNEYKIMGIKGLDYQDFCRIAAAELVNKKAHLTAVGSEKIKKIKTNMNKNRYII